MVGTPHEITMALFFVSGLGMMLVLAFVSAIVWSWQKRRFQRKADDLGVKVDFSGDQSGVDPYDIEGCGYCVIFAILVICGAFGISLPILIPAQIQTLILYAVLLIFGGLFWGVNIWGFYYLAKIPSKFQKALDEALSAEGA